MFFVYRFVGGCDNGAGRDADLFTLDCLCGWRHGCVDAGVWDVWK